MLLLFDLVGSVPRRILFKYSSYNGGKISNSNSINSGNINSSKDNG